MRDLDGQKTAEEIRRGMIVLFLYFIPDMRNQHHKSFEVQPYRFIKKNMSFAQRSRNIRAAMERMVEMNLNSGIGSKA